MFFNLLLAVTRTIMILRPFYQIKIGIVKAACILYVLPWVVLLAINIYQFHIKNNPAMTFVYQVYYKFLYMASGFATLLLSEPLSQRLKFFILVTLPDIISFLIPVSLITISCVIQIMSLHRSNQFPASSNQRHVTITVILMSTIFVLCNSAFYVYMTAMTILFVNNNPYFEKLLKDRIIKIAILGTVLPILNAALNPVIIISRSSGLRVEFLNTVRGSTQSQRADPT